MTPTYPANYLSDHLVGTFFGRKVGEVQSCVCQHNAHYAEAGQVQALTELLCSDQYIYSAVFYCIKMLVKTLRLGIVTIETLDARLGEQPLHLSC